MVFNSPRGELGIKWVRKLVDIVTGLPNGITHTRHDDEKSKGDFEWTWDMGTKGMCDYRTNYDRKMVRLTQL